MDSEKALLDLAVWHNHMIGKPGFRGKLSVPAQNLITAAGEGPARQWFKLQPKTTLNNNKADKDLGEICLSLIWKKEYDEH